MGNVIETVDILGDKVICSDTTWTGHITSGHAIMSNNINAVKDTIEDPDVIYESNQHPARNVYFKQSSISSYDAYTKVVTQKNEGNICSVVSAWPQKQIKGGIGSEIYRK